MVRQNVFATTLLPTFHRVVTPPRNRNSSLARSWDGLDVDVDCTVQYRYNILCSAESNQPHSKAGRRLFSLLLGPPSVDFPRVFSASASSMDRSLYHEDLRPFRCSRLHRSSYRYHILGILPRITCSLASCFYNLLKVLEARPETLKRHRPGPHAACI